MPQNTQTNEPNKNEGLWKKIAFIILLLLILLLLLAFLAGGSIWSSLVYIVFWAIALFVTYQFAFKKKYSLWLIIPIIIFGFILSFVIYSPGNSDATSKSGKSINSIFNSNNNTNSNTGGNNTTATNFTKKVLKISSANGDVTGTIGIEEKSDKSGKAYYYAVYNFLVKANLPFNAKCGPIGTVTQQTCGGKHYEYSGRLVRPNYKYGSGVAGAVYCNKDVSVPDPYSTSNRTYYFETCNLSNVEGIVTDTFESNFSANYDSYDAILKATTFEMYDFSNFWEETSANHYTGNTDRPITESSPVKTFTLTISE